MRQLSSTEIHQISRITGNTGASIGDGTGATGVGATAGGSAVSQVLLVTEMRTGFGARNP
jgi:hypothetical protein